MKIKDYLWYPGTKSVNRKRQKDLALEKWKQLNSMVLSKLTWKLFYDKSLRVEQMQAKYQLDESFFCYGTEQNGLLVMEVYT